jgi:hypothetical protein
LSRRSTFVRGEGNHHLKRRPQLVGLERQPGGERLFPPRHFSYGLAAYCDSARGELNPTHSSIPLTRKNSDQPVAGQRPGQRRRGRAIHSQVLGQQVHGGPIALPDRPAANRMSID